MRVLQEYFDCEDEQAFRAATGLGGGVGRMGDICGALTGSVMGIGLVYGRASEEDRESGPKTYALAEKLYDMFEKEIGATGCYDIIQTDLRNEEERQRRLAEGKDQVCKDLVQKAARLAKQVIEEG